LENQPPNRNQLSTRNNQLKLSQIVKDKYQSIDMLKQSITVFQKIIVTIYSVD